MTSAQEVPFHFSTLSVTPEPGDPPNTTADVLLAPAAELNCLASFKSAVSDQATPL